MKHPTHRRMRAALAAAQASPHSSILGILTIAAALAPIWAPPEIASKIQQSAAVIAGAGLMFTADARKQRP